METVLSPPRESSRSAPDPPAPATPAELPMIGVGIDTSRYGHYAAFLDAALQPAADELKFAESAKGYEQLRDRLGLILKRRGPVHLSIRIDAAETADTQQASFHGLRARAARAQKLA
jgi:hypothetical protein